MAAIRIVSGTWREVWRESVPLDGGTSDVITTGISAYNLARVRADCYIDAVGNTPNISGVLSINADEKLVVTITNSAAPGNTAIFTLEVIYIESTQQSNKSLTAAPVHIIGGAGLSPAFGPQGWQGWQGYLGWQGWQGAGNLPGPTGSQGNQGWQGEQGEQGWQGPGNIPGPTGTQGNQGWQGRQGQQGDLGNQGPGNLPGPQGAQGAQGWQGNQGWQGDAGNQGPGNLPGPQGAQGNQGWQGAQGEQGWQGPGNLPGAQGAQGGQGAQGRQGAQGEQGWQGPGNLPGAAGAQGNQGWQGNQGNQGNQGPGNIPGTQGAQGVQGSASGGGNGGGIYYNLGIPNQISGGDPVGFSVGNDTNFAGLTTYATNGLQNAKNVFPLIMPAAGRLDAMVFTLDGSAIAQGGPVSGSYMRIDFYKLNWNTRTSLGSFNVALDDSKVGINNSPTTTNYYQTVVLSSIAINVSQGDAIGVVWVPQSGNNSKINAIINLFGILKVVLA